MPEALSLKFPDGTRERLRTLAAPGETMTATLLRGLVCLEGQGADPEHQATIGEPGRLDALEARLEALEAASNPSEGAGSDYPPVVKAGAVAMQAAGRPTAEIRRAIEEACGRAPSPKHMAKTLRRWQGE